MLNVASWLLSSFIPKSSPFSKEPDEVRKEKSVQADQDTDFIVFFSLFSLAGTPNKVANCYQ